MEVMMYNVNVVSDIENEMTLILERLRDGNLIDVCNIKGVNCCEKTRSCSIAWSNDSYDSRIYTDWMWQS